MGIPNSVLLCLLIAGPVGTADPTGPQRPRPRSRVALEEGHVAPGFECVDDRQRMWRSRDVFGKRIVVIFFYPADFKSGCTKQAEQFRDAIDELLELDVEVVGVSGDSASNHALFKQVHKLNFRLLADEAGAAAAKFGVPQRCGGQRVLARGPDRRPILNGAGRKVFLTRNVTFARRTFIVGMDGTVVYKNTRVCPRQECEQIIRHIRAVLPN